MKLKKEFESLVKQEIIPEFKALSYKHYGPPALISMIIMQMHRYLAKKGLKQDLKLPINELEFYIESSLNNQIEDNDWVSEMNIPIVD